MQCQSTHLRNKTRLTDTEKKTYSWKVEMKGGKECEFGVSRGKLLYRDKDKQGGTMVQHKEVDSVFCDKH